MLAWQCFISVLEQGWILRVSNLVALFSCPQGYRLSEGTCVDVDECLWLPCGNGGICKNYEPPIRYECHCPIGYTGQNCELDLVAAGTIMPSKDFIIAVIVCLFILLGKLWIILKTYLNDKPHHISSFPPQKK